MLNKCADNAKVNIMCKIKMKTSLIVWVFMKLFVNQGDIKIHLLMDGQRQCFKWSVKVYVSQRESFKRWTPVLSKRWMWRNCLYMLHSCWRKFNEIQLQFECRTLCADVNNSSTKFLIENLLEMLTNHSQTAWRSTLRRCFRTAEIRLLFQSSLQNDVNSKVFQPLCVGLLNVKKLQTIKW